MDNLIIITNGFKNIGPSGYIIMEQVSEKIVAKYNTNYGTKELMEYMGLVHAMGLVKKNSEYVKAITSNKNVYKMVKCNLDITRDINITDEDVKHRIFKCMMFLTETKRLPQLS